MAGGGASPGLAVLGGFSTAGGLGGVGLGFAGISGSGGGVTVSGEVAGGAASGAAATGVAERYLAFTQPMVPSRLIRDLGPVRGVAHLFHFLVAFQNRELEEIHPGTGSKINPVAGDIKRGTGHLDRRRRRLWGGSYRWRIHRPGEQVLASGQT